jgi:hypothetical protein
MPMAFVLYSMLGLNISIQPGLLAEGRGAQSFILLECPVEMAFIGEPQFRHDLVHAHVAVLQPGLHELDLIIGDISLQVLPCLLLKILADIIQGNIEMRGDRRRFQLFWGIDMLMDIIDDIQGHSAAFRVLRRKAH